MSACVCAGRGTDGEYETYSGAQKGVFTRSSSYSVRL